MNNSKSPSLKPKSGSRLVDWLYLADQNESRTSGRLGNVLKPAPSLRKKDYSLLNPNRPKVVDPDELERLKKEYIDAACLAGKIQLGHRHETETMINAWSADKFKVEISKFKFEITEKVKQYKV